MNFKNMGQDEKKDWIETFVGGACGAIAIIAAIIEYALGDSGAIAGMLKDIFGTLVVVVLLFAAMPKRKPKNLSNILEKAVEEWGENNAPIIFKTEEYIQAQNSSSTQGFRLLQDPKNDYITLVNKKLTRNSAEWSKYARYGNGNHSTGKFLDMPDYTVMTKGSFEMTLCMEQRHFKNMPEIDKIVDNLVTAINVNCGELFNSTRIGSSHTIKLICNQIDTTKKVNDFVEAIDFVLSLVKVIA